MYMYKRSYRCIRKKISFLFNHGQIWERIVHFGRGLGLRDTLWMRYFLCNVMYVKHYIYYLSVSNNHYTTNLFFFTSLSFNALLRFDYINYLHYTELHRSIEKNECWQHWGIPTKPTLLFSTFRNNFAGKSLICLKNCLKSRQAKLYHF